MTTDRFAGLHGIDFHTWLVVGRAPSRHKGVHVYIRCRQCELTERVRKRSLITGYYRLCTRCYGPDSPIARHLPPDNYDPMSPNITPPKETHR